jgi:hypothetical protein
MMCFDAEMENPFGGNSRRRGLFLRSGKGNSEQTERNLVYGQSEAAPS